MYAKGMSQRDIEDVLKRIYGAEITQGLGYQKTSLQASMRASAQTSKTVV